MMKFIPLFLSLIIPFSGVIADDFTDQAIQFCRDKGGTYTMGDMVLEGDKYCRKVTCRKTNSGDFVVEDADKGPEANVEATKSVCVAKSVIDGNFSGSGGIDVNGDGKVDSKDDINGDGVIDGKDLEEWRRQHPESNSGNGGNSGNSGNGGNSGNSGNGGNNSSGDGSDIRCEYVLSGTLSASHPCIKYCKKQWLTGREGLERRKCRECIERYSMENGGDLVVDWDKVVAAGGKKPNKSSVKISGVQVNTGVIVCYDIKTGKEVSRTSTGSQCPAGSSTHSGGVPAPNPTAGAASGAGAGGGVVISGGAGGNVQLPAFCQSTKHKDKVACENWMRANARFACASSSNPTNCIGNDYNEIQSRYNYDGCVNCGGRGRGRDNSWLGDALGGLFLGAGSAVGAYFNGQAYIKGQEAWAGAAAAGFEQCQINQNNYLQYLQANELPALSPEQQAAMGCNGFGLNQYGGLGGAYGAYGAGGYSNGFLGGMYGPYGGYNPYGGGIVGGAVGGMTGGYVGGYPGGYAGGIAGGYPAGVAGGIVGGAVAGGYVGGYPGGYAGGIAGGYPAGVAGGYVAGGYAGGYPGGYAGGVAGGYPAGVAGGYVTGGYAGGYPGGIAGGMVNGVSIAGGVAGGYPGGYAGGYAGGYPGGYAGGYAGGIAGGYVNGASIAGGVNGGGYYPGGYNPGGWGSGAGQWGGGGYGGQGNYWAASQQTSGYDQMLQNQGISYQMGMNTGAGSYGGYGGYGGGYNAGFSPFNVGATFGGNVGGGWYGP